MWLVGLVVVASAPSFIVAGRRQNDERLNTFRLAAVVCTFGGGVIIGAGYRSTTAGVIALVATIIVLLAIIVIGTMRGQKTG